MEDFRDSPVLESVDKQVGVESFMEGETPASLFSSLPIMLYYRYTSIAFGNERSSNAGNLVWEHTGEDINHQWEKSSKAEILFSKYI